MKFKFTLLFVFAAIFSFSELKATHVMGGEITYTCIGPDQYRIRLTLYRDCNGVALNSTASISLTSPGCTSFNRNLNRIGTPTDISPLCSTVSSRCNGTGGSNVGIEQHIYELDVTLPNCGTEWRIGYSICCRNNAINTLNNPGGQNLAVYSTLNRLTSPCNNSPIFNNEPTAVICVNQPFTYNHGVSDSDNDSLHFSLGNCIRALPNTSVTYVAGRNALNPLPTLNGVTIDPNTGAISFTPNTLINAVICVYVREFRNGVLIGEYIRDIQISVINCSNPPPLASGFDETFNNSSSGTYTTSICANRNFCFNLNFQDANDANLTISWNEEIAGANFTINNNNTTNPTATFCWTPSIANTGLNSFSVNIFSDVCPVVSSSVYTYAINVLPSTVTNINYTGCQGDGYQVVVNGVTYNQTNPSGSQTLLRSNGCDSVVNVNLNYLANSTGSVNYIGCQGDGYQVVVNGVTYNQSNPTGTQIFTNTNNCDSTVTINLVYHPNTIGTVNYNGCSGDGYQVIVNGVTYNESNPSGSQVLSNSNNCDSTVTVNLIYNLPNSSNITYTGCQGDGYQVVVNGVTYDEANPSGTEILLNANNCDSTVNINLNYSPVSSGSVLHNGCEGDNFQVIVNGVTYNESNPSGIEILQNSNNCDSTVTIDLIFIPTSGNVSYTGCEGDGYQVIVNGVTYNENNPTGTEVLLNQNNCDSIVTVNLFYLPNTSGSETYTGCQGDGYQVVVNGVTYNETNPTGTEILINANNCDSTVTINLVYLPNTTGSETYTGCQGDGYQVVVNGVAYNETNPTGTEVLLNANNCDSTVTINLVYLPNTTGSETYTGCEGDGYQVVVNGVAYNETNPTGTEVLVNANNCDSTVTINLVYLPNTTGSETYIGCQGDGYQVVVNGVAYNETNPTGTEVLVNANNCDSTVNINLVYLPNTTGSETYTGCEGDGYQVVVNGVTYNETNPTGTEILINANNCDSTVTINLVYLPNTTGSETYTGCEGDGYQVIVNGVTYNEANPTGTEILVNTNNCDSTVTINLVYLPHTTGAEIYTGCEGDGYQIVVNGIIYNEANPVGTEVLVNANNCDSTVTINLIYLPNSTGTETYTGCQGDGYQVIVNGVTYNETNPTGTEILVNANNCDSTVSINLVYLPNTTGTESYTGCQGDGYQVVVNGITYNEANPTGTEVLVNTNNCDSTVSINLVYLPNTSGTESYTGCQGDGYQVVVNGVTYNEANPTGSEVLLNANNCDSTVTINLIYLPNTFGNISYTGCNGNGYFVEVNGVIYDENNPVGTEILTNANNCDSTVTINLQFLPNVSSTVEYIGCEGDGFEVVVNGNTYNEVNPTGTEVLINANNCDSTVNINLIYLPNTFGSETYIGCEGDGYQVIVNNVVYNQTNPTGTEVLINANNCDSTVTINLVYLPNSFGAETYTGCEGDGYQVVVNGIVYNEANPTGTEILVNQNNCDSTVNINLVYLPNTIGTESYTGCEGDGYQVVVNGVTYNEANPTGTEILVNANNCDSTVTINLVYLPNTTGTETYTGCEGDGYQIVVNGVTYNEANPSGTQVLVNQNNCDSTVTINLVFLPNNAGSETYTGCQGDGYQVVVNGVVYNEVNPTGTEILVNQNNCDSTVTINLVYLPNTSGSENYTGCQGDGYQVVVNGVSYNESNPTGTEVLVNANNCDSTVTINLVYLPNTTGSETYTGCEGDGYQIFVNGTLYNENNPTGTEILVNANNCDSTVTINLVYLPNNTSIEFNESCNPSDTGVFVFNLINQFGCDSVHTNTVALLPTSFSFDTLYTCFENEISLVEFDFINQFGCDSTHSIFTLLIENNYNVFPDFAVIAGGESFEFIINNEDDNLEFSWVGTNGESCGTPCDIFTLNPYDYTVLYYFTLTDTSSGCIATDTLRIDVEFTSELNIPNIFTPNGDGQNDVFRVYGTDIFEFSMMIFDRWGGKVFETTNLNDGWDGTLKGQPVQSGVYIAIIEATGLDARKFKQTINIKLAR